MNQFNKDQSFLVIFGRSDLFCQIFDGKLIILATWNENLNSSKHIFNKTP